jgi:glycine/D-amino acid oxidase-like deaminating enzyme
MIQKVQATIQGGRNPDVIVVGAGVFGLWAARRAIAEGKRVLVLDKRHAGAGASGGFLGALMPHMPDRWNAKKQQQFDCLVGLERAVRALEADTGMDCGYRRCGRLMPLAHERMPAIVDARIAGAAAHWRGYRMERISAPFTVTLAEGWLSSEAATFGAQWDDLSARIDPRALIASLAAHVRGRGELREGCEVVAVASRRVTLADGSRLSAAEIIVANGFEAYPLLQPHMGQITGGAPIGRGVKGQAVLLRHPHADDRPIVYADGVYAVPQKGDRVAIGSSTVEHWQDGDHPAPDAFDPADIDYHARAVTMVPALAGAPVIERWAGVRPRNMLDGRSTEPFLGPVPGLAGVTALIGGFKTGMAIAWRG